MELKEVLKNLEFFKRVSPYFYEYHSRKKYALVDLCAGKGLASLLFHLFGEIDESLMFDKNIPTKFKRETQPELDRGTYRYQYKDQDILSEDFSLNVKKRSSVIAIHPCSYLADRIIELSMAGNFPFAIMTCCHNSEPPEYNLRDPPTPKLLCYDKKEDYVDALRKKHIEESGWSLFEEKIPERITPRNRIIIGIPQKS